MGAEVPAAGELGKAQNKLFSIKEGMILRASATSFAVTSSFLMSLEIFLEFWANLLSISSSSTRSTRTLHLPRYGAPDTVGWNLRAMMACPEGIWKTAA
jgi:hypothetical protein